jgi:cell division protein FtsZ
MPKINPDIENFARIKVIGVGGSGKGAINHMIESRVKNVEFIAVNTDVQDLHNCLAERKIHIGKNFTKGLGAGMNPDVGKRSAEETKEEIQNSVKGADMVFITCGMGGGTGTGAAPTIAKISKDEGVLTVAVTTKPFFFEGAQRMKIAEQGLAELEQNVDALIVIPNDKLLAAVDKNTSLKDAFAMCDEVLKQAVEGISELISNSGIMNVDFADVRAVMQDSGTALMGVGRGAGENRAVEAAHAAINSPLLDVSIHGARGVLFAISGSDDLSLFEVQEAAKIITESVDKDAKIIFGAFKDDTLKKDEVKVTVIATGFPTVTNNKRTTPLFGGNMNASQIQSSMERPINRAPVVESERREINNVLPVADIETKKDTVVSTNPQTTSMASQKPQATDIVNVIDEDTDDWGAVPAFLRRRK